MLIPLGILAVAGAGGAAATPAYDLIATATVSGSSKNIDFTSIPQDYKHLQIRFVAKVTTTTQRNIQFQFNGITTTSYAAHRLIGNGTTVTSTASTTIDNIEVPNTIARSTTAGLVGAGIVDILDYASTSKNTTLRGLFGLHDSTNQVTLASGLFNNTAAISSIRITHNGGTTDYFDTISRFSLYGIKG